MKASPKTFLPSLFLLLLAAAPLAGEWGDPHGFFNNESIEKREIYPGVTAWSASGELKGQPLRSSIVAIDLSKRDLALEALIGARFVNTENGQFFRRSTTSQLQQDNEALAAINVAFFDIQATQAPEGLTVSDGIVLREPSGRTNVLYLPDGRVTLAELNWKAHIQLGAQRRPLRGVNRPALGGDEVVLYLPPWAVSPGESAGFTKGQQIREVLVERTGFEAAATISGRSRITGRILEVRDRQPGVAIGENRFVLTASQSAAPFFRNARTGAEVEIQWQLTDAPEGVAWHEAREIVSSGPYLVRGGSREEGGGSFWEGRHPRSALGISRDGQRCLFVVIDGRSEESVGIGLGDLADLLVHLGAHEALNFDGGGSSALAARIDGESVVLNKPSDKSERYIPTGLGVVPHKPRLDQTRVWTGANGRAMTGIFHDYDDTSEQVTLILEDRRFTFPLSSLSEADQALILRRK